MKTKFIKLSIIIAIMAMNFSGHSQIKKDIDLTEKTPDYSTLKPYKNKTCNASNVHKNFRDIVQQISKIDTVYNYGYLLQITTISPGTFRNSTNTPSHYFTAWGKTSIYDLDSGLCSFSSGMVNIKFSDRDLFKGKEDKVSYVFYPKNNSVKVTLHSWGNSESMLYNLEKNGNLIYHTDSKGVMTVFNFLPARSPRIQ